MASPIAKYSTIKTLACFWQRAAAVQRGVLPNRHAKVPNLPAESILPAEDAIEGFGNHLPKPFSLHCMRQAEKKSRGQTASVIAGVTSEGCETASGCIRLRFRSPSC
jgi:hypothetical protein